MDDLELIDFTDMSVPGIPEATGMYASGPFAVDHGDDWFVGLMFGQFGDDGLAFLDTRHDNVRVFSGTPKIDGKKITLTNMNDKYTLRPMTLRELRSKLGPSYKNASLLEARVGFLRTAMPDTSIAYPELAVTLNDDGSVVAMFMIDAGGSMYRRTEGTWQKLSADSENEDDLEDLEWVPVLSAAISVYDQLDQQENVYWSDLEEYAA